MARELVIVTGASRGIGAAIASRLAREESVVALLARDARALGDVAERLHGRGMRVDIAPVDVTDLPAMEDALTRLCHEHGPIRLLVNNAGGNPYYKPALETSPDEWDHVMGLNLRAAFFAATAAARAMIDDGVDGSIVNISSVGAHVAVPNTLPYCASKAALAHLTKGLALELAPHGIRVNAVAPGYAQTDLTAGLRGRPERLAEMEAAIPLGRLADPEEVADCVAFLAEASYVTGAILTVDGGYSLPPPWPATRRRASAPMAPTHSPAR